MERIALPSDILFTFVGLDITNAMFTALMLTLVFLVIGLIVRRNFGIVPSRFQVVLEAMIDFIWGNVKTAFGDEKKARKFFPMLMTMFLFIIVANEMSIIPLVFEIVKGEVSVFRLPTSDLSMTIGFALFVVLLANALALRIAPLKHIGNFIRIKPLLQIRKPGDIGMALLEIFFGVLDLISEIAKVLSLSFRLFGNIFAGEVMVVVIAGLSAYTTYLVPIPFIVLSLFAGLIQALVFVLLSTQYIAGTINQYNEKKEGTKLATEPA